MGSAAVAQQVETGAVLFIALSDAFTGTRRCYLHFTDWTAAPSAAILCIEFNILISARVLAGLVVPDLEMSLNNLSDPAGRGRAKGASRNVREET